MHAAPLEEVDKHTSHVDDVAVKKVATTTKMPKSVEILENGSEHNMDGSYSFHYRGSDGSFREETAVVKNAGTEHEYLEVTGAYSYFDTDGKEVVVHYTAGDRGFVPVGNNIPEEISKSAKANSELPALEDSDEDDDEMEVVSGKKKN